MEKIQFRPNPESDARVVGYLHNAVPEEMPQGVDRPCVLVCPGGGYVSLPEKESDPPALAFFARGYQVFVLSYSIGKKAADLRPLIDGSLTLMKIRENSGKWHVLPDKIAVLGFSAGGHVAASIGTLWDTPELKARIDTKGGLNRPDAMVLCYAVLTAGALTHPGSVRTICGGNPTPEQIKFFSLENHVTPETPPTFLWHTVEDDCVPVENSMIFAAALRKNHVPFECHLFQKGRHGMSMCNAEVESENPHAAAWFPLCAEWLDDLFRLFRSAE